MLSNECHLALTKSMLLSQKKLFSQKNGHKQKKAIKCSMSYSESELDSNFAINSSESDSESDSNFSLTFMNLDIGIFFTLYLHSSK